MSTEAVQVVTVVFSGLAGLLVGSFLNVVVYRVPLHESIVRPPSHCPTCSARLSALDMVPVASWIVLRGRCRHCTAPVSARYPVVELATAAVFAGTAAALGTLWPLASVVVVCACALCAAIIDADGGGVPAAVAVTAAVGALSLVPIAAALGTDARIGWAALGAVLAVASAAIVDRTAGRGRWWRVAVLSTLGWTAGWLWAGGGPFVTAWVVVATAASGVGSGRRAPLAVLIAGSFAAVLASAVINRP